MAWIRGFDLKRTYNICDIHDEIKLIAREIQSLDEDDLEKANTLASNIEDLADYALGLGQRMENRMKEYREGIEALGFKREK